MVPDMIVRLIALAALPAMAAAEPITLKLSFFTSDRTIAYVTAIKPFGDAINNDNRRLLKIDVYTSGALDGATVPAAQLFDVGIGRFASNHYLLGTSVAPLTLMMNRKVFDRLPADAQALIRRHSGQWTAERFIRAYEAVGKKAFEDIRADARRSIVVPSSADQLAAQEAFNTVIQDWAAASVHNQALLDLTQATLAKLRSPK